MQGRLRPERLLRRCETQRLSVADGSSRVSQAGGDRSFDARRWEPVARTAGVHLFADAHRAAGRRAECQLNGDDREVARWLRPAPYAARRPHAALSRSLASISIPCRSWSIFGKSVVLWPSYDRLDAQAHPADRSRARSTACPLRKQCTAPSCREMRQIPVFAFLISVRSAHYPCPDERPSLEAEGARPTPYLGSLRIPR